LRGVAVLAVFFYHCHPRLEGTPFYHASLWGWAGVNLFFVLSGFLITSILLQARGEEHYFRNFYGRRALRIWPVYVLVLSLCGLLPDWFLNQGIDAFKHAGAWVACGLLVQNLLHLTMPSAIEPTWSLAIEEQYYFVWAPAVRWVRRPWMLAVVLALALVASPMLRMGHHAWLTRTHTLIHLDGIAMGSLIALGLHTVGLARRVWLWMGLGAAVAGFVAAGTVAGGTAFLDSALAVGFGGAMVAAMASTGRAPGDRSSPPGWGGTRNPMNAILRRGPLAYYGKISYGLYMTHIMTFIYFGWVDRWIDSKTGGHSLAGNLGVAGFRLTICTLVATVLWYGFESRILRLKRWFAPARPQAGKSGSQRNEWKWKG